MIILPNQPPCCYELRLKQTWITILEKASAAAASAADADASEAHKISSKV